ncbi:MAG: aminotransferase class I/II-fold pyridoxal phosphate-dependent enzyme [Thermoplasmata archaeon]|nr:aminotransferase class I/II-fold pyridoxal phosphate-dependent enzyme [Thermoplasmata archaeon]
MVAQRVREVEISGIRKMFEAAPPNAINLGLGEPDFDPPKVIVDALCDAVRNGMNHYGPSAGLPALREKVAERYHDRVPDTSRENIIITGSGSEGLMTAALTLYDPGDEVLVPDPGFVLYAPHARLAGATPVPYPLDESRGYQPDLDELAKRVTARTRALVVNSPSNPTGGVFSKATIERLVAFAEAHELTIVSDEVYEEMVYEGQFQSVWGLTERAVVVHSFSKMFAMTGWRLGFLVAPRSLAVELNKLHYHIMACPSTPAQAAVLAGLNAEPEESREMIREFRARRELITRGLNRIPGLKVVPPAGAFYAFPRFSWPGTSQEIAGSLLQRGLITTPGDAFGTLGAGHLRLSFAASRENLRKGMGILRTYAREALAA